jgi:hypothetical protein
MILLNPILDKLLEQLADHPALINENIQFSRSECVNEDANQAPWVGLYTKTVKHDPETLATIHRRWKSTPTLVIVVQQASLKSGADCSTRLEVLIRDVLNAIVNDTSFSAEIDMVNKLDVTYKFEKRIDLHYIFKRRT